jgi:glycosyltransferase involved in cell wall biosynthesis
MVLPKTAVRVIHNVVDTARFFPAAVDGRTLDQLSGLPVPDSPCLRIGLVATYARWKGHEVFLKAARALLDRGPQSPVRFYVIGGPIYATAGSQWTRAELLQQITELNLSNHVGLVEFQQDPADIYRALDIVVHASTQPEPFGLTIIEAMACGKPVVVSQAGGATELFTGNVDALGASPANAEELASRLQALAIDDALRTRLGEAAQRTARNRFSRDHLGTELSNLYASAVPTGSSLEPGTEANLRRYDCPDPYDGNSLATGS